MSRPAEGGEPDEAFDFAFALFGAIFQMRDWIKTSRPDLANAVFGLYRASPNLALVRDVANGAKHMTLHHYSIDGAATVAREYAGGGRSRLVVPCPGGRNVECLQLADACIAEIRCFMEGEGLL